MEFPSIQPAGDSAFMVDLGTGIDAALNQRVHRAANLVRERFAGYPRVDVTPAFAAFLVSFDLTVVDPDDVRRSIVDALQELRDSVELVSAAYRRFTIPVHYGDEHGPDLRDVATEHGMSEDEVVERHTGRDYRIFCLGFSPGFPFLAGLDPHLATPRLRSPRPRIPAGSVAIGGSQTGIYPTASPGGWRLIGRAVGVFFDADAAPPVPYAAGDAIRFEAITRERFDELSASRQPLVWDVVDS